MVGHSNFSDAATQGFSDEAGAERVRAIQFRIQADLSHAPFGAFPDSLGTDRCDLSPVSRVHGSEERASRLAAHGEPRLQRSHGARRPRASRNRNRSALSNLILFFLPHFEQNAVISTEGKIVSPQGRKVGSSQSGSEAKSNDAAVANTDRRFLIAEFDRDFPDLLHGKWGHLARLFASQSLRAGNQRFRVSAVSVERAAALPQSVEHTVQAPLSRRYLPTLRELVGDEQANGLSAGREAAAVRGTAPLFEHLPIVRITRARGLRPSSVAQNGLFAKELCESSFFNREVEFELHRTCNLSRSGDFNIDCSSQNPNPHQMASPRPPPPDFLNFPRLRISFQGPPRPGLNKAPGDDSLNCSRFRCWRKPQILQFFEEDSLVTERSHRRRKGTFQHVVSSDYIASPQAVEIPQSIRNLVPDGEWTRAAKAGWHVLIRPGWDWRVRIYAGMHLQSHGYHSELLVKLVNGRLVPLPPAGLAGFIQEISLEQLKRSNIPPHALLKAPQIKAIHQKVRQKAEEKKRIATDAELNEAVEQAGLDLQLITGPNLRREMENFELQDGCVVRVRPDCKPIKLVGLTFDEALNQKLVTPLASFKPGDPELKKLAGRSLVYFLYKPRPASLEAFLRHADSDDETAESTFVPNERQERRASGDENQLQLFATWGKEFGIDPAILRHHPDLQPLMVELAKLNERRQKDEDAYQRKLLMARSKAELIAREAGSTLTGQQQQLKFNTKVSAPQNPIDSLKKGHTPQHSPVSAVGNSETTADRRGAGKVSEAEVYTILEAMQRFCLADDDAAERLITECRSHAPNCTVVQIAEAIEVKGPLCKGRNVTNPVGLLLSSVPKIFAGNSWKISVQRTGERKPLTREENVEYLRRHWNDLPEAERNLYLSAFPELAQSVRGAAGD